MGMCGHPQLFTWVLGTQMQYLKLAQQTLYSQSHLDSSLGHIHMLSVQTDLISNVSFISMRLQTTIFTLGY